MSLLGTGSTCRLADSKKPSSTSRLLTQPQGDLCSLTPASTLRTQTMLLCRRAALGTQGRQWQMLPATSGGDMRRRGHLCSRFRLKLVSGLGTRSSVCSAAGGFMLLFGVMVGSLGGALFLLGAFYVSDDGSVDAAPWPSWCWLGGGRGCVHLRVLSRLGRSMRIDVQWQARWLSDSCRLQCCYRVKKVLRSPTFCRISWKGLLRSPTLCG